MTIKEEIQNIIYMKIGKDKVEITWNETKEITNEILKIFEKIIDIRMKIVSEPKTLYEKDIARLDELNRMKNELKK